MFRPPAAFILCLALGAMPSHTNAELVTRTLDAVGCTSAMQVPVFANHVDNRGYRRWSGLALLVSFNSTFEGDTEYPAIAKARVEISGDNLCPGKPTDPTAGCAIGLGRSTWYSQTAELNWNLHDTLHDLTASANGNIAYPITALRFCLTDHTAGSVTLVVTEGVP